MIKIDDNLVINIHVSYVEDTYTMEDGEQYKVYDFSPVRQWQHLSILEYATYIHCKSPRIVMGDKKVKVVLPPWAEAYVIYTRLFSLFVI